VTRTRNIPAIDAARERYRNNDTWSDYDSDIIHGDYRVDEVDGVMEVTELRAYQPGIATVDRLAGGSSAVTYYHTDMIGTTRFMTDGNGVIGEEATYTAFGEKVCSLPGGDCTNTPDHRYGYAGAYGYQSTINDTTGVADFPFLHVGHRYYDPALGRFLQRDPIGIRGGFNVYAYVQNSPAIFVDPDGLQEAPAVPPYYAAGGAAAAKEAAEVAAFLACAMGGGEWARRNVRKPGSKVGDGVDIPIKGHPQAPKYKKPKPPGHCDGHPKSFPSIAIVIVLIMWAFKSTRHRRQVTV
jgi:RHS repeat-associated protein